MTEDLLVSHEKESCLGISTLELAQRVIGNSSSIEGVHLRVHNYIPHSHIEYPEHSLNISKGSFLKMQQKDLDKLAEVDGEGWNVSLCSDVALQDGRRGHLILADLAPKKSIDNLALIKKRFNEVIKPEYGGGFILETGTSYHYFGEGIVSQEQWPKLLGSLLLTSIVTDMPDGMLDVHNVLVDYRYVGHSLKREYAALRLTTKGTKTFSPITVDFI